MTVKGMKSIIYTGSPMFLFLSLWMFLCSLYKESIEMNGSDMFFLELQTVFVHSLYYWCNIFFMILYYLFSNGKVRSMNSGCFLLILWLFIGVGLNLFLEGGGMTPFCWILLFCMAYKNCMDSDSLPIHSFFKDDINFYTNLCVMESFIVLSLYLFNYKNIVLNDLYIFILSMNNVISFFFFFAMGACFYINALLLFKKILTWKQNYKSDLLKINILCFFILLLYVIIYFDAPQEFLYLQIILIPIWILIYMPFILRRSTYVDMRKVVIQETCILNRISFICVLLYFAVSFLWATYDINHFFSFGSLFWDHMREAVETADGEARGFLLNLIIGIVILPFLALRGILQEGMITREISISPVFYDYFTWKAQIVLLIFLLISIYKGPFIKTWIEGSIYRIWLYALINIGGIYIPMSFCIIYLCYELLGGYGYLISTICFIYLPIRYIFVQCLQKHKCIL